MLKNDGKYFMYTFRFYYSILLVDFQRPKVICKIAVKEAERYVDG